MVNIAIDQGSEGAAFHADVPTPLTSAEPKNKFLSYCSQISARDHM